MPNRGYASITVSKGVYDAFFKVWKKQKHEMNMQGVNSFSAFITHKISKLLDIEDQTTKKERGEGGEDG